MTVLRVSVVGLALLGACDAFSAGSETPASPVDAGMMPIADAAPAAPPAEAGPSVADAAGDGVAADAGPPAACTTSNVFLDDFERAMLVGAWDNTAQGGSGVALLPSMAIAHSPARSIQGATATALGDRSFYLYRLFTPASPPCIELSFWLDVTKEVMGGVIIVASIEFSAAGGSNTALQLVLQGGAIGVQEQSFNPTVTRPVGAKSAIDKDMWHEVKLTYDRAAGLVFIRVDAAPPQAVAYTMDHKGAEAVHLGVAYAQPAAVGEFSIDDVRVTK